MKSAKKKVLVRKPQNVIPSLKLFHNDRDIDRVTLDEWTLPNDKEFPDF